MLSYRELIASDADAVQTLRLQVHTTNPESFSTTIEAERGVPVDTLGSVLDSYRQSTSCLCYGAFDSSLVGMIGAEKIVIESSSTAQARLWGLYILKDHRCQGIGTKLISHALAFAGSLEGVESVVLEVSNQSIDAIRLYERFGFRVVDVSTTSEAGNQRRMELKREVDAAFLPPG